MALLLPLLVIASLFIPGASITGNYIEAGWMFFGVAGFIIGGVVGAVVGFGECRLYLRR